MNKKRLFLFVTSLLLLVFVGDSMAKEKTGTLELIGVPSSIQGGWYDSNSGVFFVDLVEIEGAFVRVSYEDMQITGEKLEWHTKDDYFIFTEGAKLEKDDFVLESKTLEYYGNEEKLTAAGDVVVTTEDAVIRSQRLVYLEETDEALFTDDVIVEVAEGRLQGQRFLMFVEKKEMQFFGPFQGQFSVDSNK
jgi:lipopolysaccharide export system protein LptA